MKRILAIVAPAALLVGSASAQDALADKMKAEIQMAMERSKVAAVGGVMGRVVKSAPYSAQEINESSQVLADGTRIHNESRATVYRDSEGRVRRESGDDVTIWDPVAGVNYMLNTKSMTATKTSMAPAIFKVQSMTGFGGATAVVGARGGVMTAGEPMSRVTLQDGMIVVTRDGKTEKFPAPPDGNWTSDDGKIRAVIKQSTDASGGQHATFTVHEGAIAITENGQTHTMALPVAESGTGYAGTMARMPLSVDVAMGKAMDEVRRKTSLGATNNLDLGEEVIEGVKGRGTRSITTIEAGAIGNDRALTTVAERWYSDELQTEILNKRSDPRSGENTFRMININRSEPGAYLFQVPNGYTVNDRR